MGNHLKMRLLCFLPHSGCHRECPMRHKFRLSKKKQYSKVWATDICSTWLWNLVVFSGIGVLLAAAYLYPGCMQDRLYPIHKWELHISWYLVAIVNHSASTRSPLKKSEADSQMNSTQLQSKLLLFFKILKIWHAIHYKGLSKVLNNPTW